MNLVLFGLMWLVIIYLLNCAIAREWKKVEPKMALMYFSTVALIGVFGELFLDTVYKLFVGVPLWRYNILPIHGGYTSSYAIVVWGLYGFYLYLMHGSLAKWSINKTHHLALIFSLEALVLEAVVTISAKLLLGHYMYYYLPSDLWHVTSVQNMPFYLICGFVLLAALKRFKSDPLFFSAMSGSLLLVVVFLI